MDVGILGIDEAGRGPLAGPVAVAVFGIKMNTSSTRRFPKGKDSKKMTEREREKWFSVFEDEKKNGNLYFEVAFSSASMIDRMGIVYAISHAMEKCLKTIPHTSKLLLDGALSAPSRFSFQKTIIKGDEKEKLIACASIIAKVSRDRLMKQLSKKHPEYFFEIHKGYGTLRHREVIKKRGLCSLHRKTFCGNIHLVKILK